LTEQDLINKLVKGDENAFKTLINTYSNMVYNTVLGFLQNTGDAEDISQEVFIKVFEKIGSFRQQCKLSTWIYRISITQATDYLRYCNREKRRGFVLKLFSQQNQVEYEPAEFAHPGVLAERKEQSIILFKAINKLPENQKTAFLLQKVQDCSQKEIADIMQLNEGAVESLLSRAKANLKKQLFTYYSSL